MKFRVGLLIVLLLVMSAVSAQDAGSIYEDIPQTRGEDGAFILGDPDAPVTIIEFADFLCPHCQDYHDEVVQELITTYVVEGLANFEYRFFPIIDENLSPLMSALNECAAEDGKFWEANDALYEIARNREFQGDLITNLAERIDADADELTACVSTVQQFAVDYQLGSELGVTGTPAIRVRVGDGAIGILRIAGTEYSRGGVSLSVLGEFIESDDPSELVSLPNRLLNENLLNDNSLVSSDPCSAPCWNGIIPGETTWEDALALLVEIEGFTEPQINEAQNGIAKLATWGEIEGEPCCEMITSDGETVDFLRLLMAPGVTLGEVIDVHGEPNYLIGSEFTNDQALFTLFFMDLPAIVFAHSAGGVDSELTQDSEIVGVQYITTGDMNSVLADAQLNEWAGYQSYLAYQEAELIQPEVPEAEEE